MVWANSIGRRPVKQSSRLFQLIGSPHNHLCRQMNAVLYIGSSGGLEQVANARTVYYDEICWQRQKEMRLLAGRFEFTLAHISFCIEIS